ncbi:uncharacterized protein LOC133822973 isoform X2 [Humulus lupulus]|uniref:uncharacterized protein LOC133822973 isoform X2 n=1 Tax=Humulus lupulus TaxID=3486 RepID=UPI002B40F2F8|nr:uncharacterized protein LOC133822973 isoform X2 [Humulus lupulus]
MLMSTCFGHLLDLKSYNMQAQVILHALMRELYQTNDDEMWFDFRGKRVRFGLGEFSIITGLKCYGDYSLERFNISNKFVDKYFSDQNVCREVIQTRFGSSKFEDDDIFAVKLAALYFLSNYLMSKHDGKLVEDNILNLVGSDEFETFPWGKLVFDLTLKELQASFKGMHKKKVGEKEKSVIRVAGNPTCPSSKTYKLGGFPLAFQCWLYEMIPNLKDEGFCFYDEEQVFRISKWSSTSKPEYSTLEKKVFVSSVLKVNHIIPTEEGAMLLDIKNFNVLSMSDSEMDDDFQPFHVKGKMTHVGECSSMPPPISIDKDRPQFSDLIDRIKVILIKQDQLDLKIDNYKSHIAARFDVLEKIMMNNDTKMDIFVKALKEIKQYMFHDQIEMITGIQLEKEDNKINGEIEINDKFQNKKEENKVGKQANVTQDQGTEEFKIEYDDLPSFDIMTQNILDIEFMPNNDTVHTPSVQNKNVGQSYTKNHEDQNQHKQKPKEHKDNVCNDDKGIYGKSAYKDAIVNSNDNPEEKKDNIIGDKSIQNEAVDVVSGHYDDDVGFVKALVHTVDEVIKCYADKKNEEYSNLVVIEAGLVSRKRSAKPGVHTQDPFTSEFGIAKKTTLSKSNPAIKTIKGLFPFYSDLEHTPHFSEQLAFDQCT